MCATRAATHSVHQSSPSTACSFRPSNFLVHEFTSMPSSEASKHVGIIAPHERFSATKLGTVLGTVYRRKHSKDAEVLRLSH